ncbi:hypothetical protein [Acidovorax sp. SUPP2825]|uniref:hypothetical protein n=1 Tax=Acidovorax sp. SUPP2825 TaxID=2920879 RepID=UPI0023DE5C9E|nr:hypothetical protein [Acidovorax sp. SUPP2825]GKS96921.1 hypothetical protein AVAK2825_20320 [Acidovorax sp. SUPP2825]
MTTAIQMRIRGTVTSAVCRTTTAGLPMVEVYLTDPTGQQVRARHTYPDSTPANHFAANAFAKRVRGQVAELDATAPKFRARRIDCEAQHIALPFEQQTTRKDLE